MDIQKDWKAAVFGHAVGDALGVPVEFESREFLREHPVSKMQGYGSYDVPAGTWSDDTSMLLATIDSLQNGLDYNDIMDKFCNWANDGVYTPYGDMFDIGISTRKALLRYMLNKESPLLCGGQEETENGNGSLMRILPGIFYCQYNWRKEDFFSQGLPVIHNLSALTHAHPRSMVGCGLYACAVSSLLDFRDKNAVIAGIKRAAAYYRQTEFQQELRHYESLWSKEFPSLPASEIRSTGYVVDTLKAAVWCLLTTNSFQECVLKAVNLGGDTDTIGAIAGGMAGILYGLNGIPEEWLSLLARLEYIDQLCDSFCHRVLSNPTKG